MSQRVGAHPVLDTDDVLDLRFDIDPVRMRPRDDPGGLFRGLGQVQVGGVEQDRGPARVDYGPGEFQVGAVIQVQGQRNVRACGQFLEHPGQETRAERLGGARGYLHDGGRAFLPGRADDRSQRQPVEYVERPDGVSPVLCRVDDAFRRSPHDDLPWYAISTEMRQLYPSRPECCGSSGNP